MLNKNSTSKETINLKVSHQAEYLKDTKTFKGVTKYYSDIAFLWIEQGSKKTGIPHLKIYRVESVSEEGLKREKKDFDESLRVLTKGKWNHR